MSHRVSLRESQLSFDDQRRRSGRGGPRSGAGRPPGPRPRVHHVRRPEFSPRHPAHVTLRVRRGLPSLRRRSFSAPASPQPAPVAVATGLPPRSLLRPARPPAPDRRGGLSRRARAGHAGAGAEGGACREPDLGAARAGSGRALSPAGARHTARGTARAAYVLLNARRHARGRGRLVDPRRLDEASSGRWFDGWSRELPAHPATGPPETGEARTWVLRTGWRRHGRIDPAEIPGGRRVAR